MRIPKYLIGWGGNMVEMINKLELMLMGLRQMNINSVCAWFPNMKKEDIVEIIKSSNKFKIEGNMVVLKSETEIYEEELQKDLLKNLIGDEEPVEDVSDDLDLDFLDDEIDDNIELMAEPMGDMNQPRMGSRSIQPEMDPVNLYEDPVLVDNGPMNNMNNMTNMNNMNNMNSMSSMNTMDKLGGTTGRMGAVAEPIDEMPNNMGMGREMNSAPRVQENEDDYFDKYFEAVFDEPESDPMGMGNGVVQGGNMQNGMQNNMANSVPNMGTMSTGMIPGSMASSMPRDDFRQDYVRNDFNNRQEEFRAPVEEVRQPQQQSVSVPPMDEYRGDYRNESVALDRVDSSIMSEATGNAGAGVDGSKLTFDEVLRIINEYNSAADLRMKYARENKKQLQIKAIIKFYEQKYNVRIKEENILNSNSSIYALVHKKKGVEVAYLVISPVLTNNVIDYVMHKYTDEVVYFCPIEPARVDFEVGLNEFYLKDSEVIFDRFLENVEVTETVTKVIKRVEVITGRK